MFDYMTVAINGDLFNLAEKMNNEIRYRGYDIIAVQFLSQNKTLALLKRPAIIEPFPYKITEVPSAN